MAKFVFPMTESEFVAAVKNASAFNKLGGDIGFAYSCIKMGWQNKQFHKASQMKSKAMDEAIKKAMESDPELKKRLLSHIEKKTS